MKPINLSNGHGRARGRWSAPEPDPPPTTVDYFLAFALVGLLGALSGAFAPMIALLGAMP